jgi:hypothetical protein
MKGIIFREFLEMVEEKFGYELVDEILVNSELESNGIYTAVGTYNHHELFILGSAVASKTNIQVNQLFKLFGIYVFGTFTRHYSHLITQFDNPFDFLSNIENGIHVEVLKLYPEAELPTFKIEKRSDNEIIMIYKSKRKMADFAEGLIIGSLNYFKIEATIKKHVLVNDQTMVKFSIKR